MQKSEPILIKNELESKHIPIVAIGASAGGLEAVTELLNNLPDNSGMAYVYIQHLEPNHKSSLVEILSRTTKMKVQETKNSMPVEPNKLYIIPPGKDMYLTQGILKLHTRKPKPELHLPIDNFFISLAENQGEASIGVLLSGSANDGTRGMKAIKTAGGLTFAQNDTAKFQSMPKSAIAEGYVDMILSPKEIGEQLSLISKNTNLFKVALALKEPTETDVKDEDLGAIIQLLKKSTSVDFKHYKMNTIKRRIIRRMLLYKLETLADYFKYLKEHTNEINVLYQDLLINVTSFFRDPDTLEFLQKTILPKIIKEKSTNQPIRIWVPACSTGEEAYSIAITLIEILSERGSNIPVQIFATDLSEFAIAKARLGLYSKNDLQDISPKRLQRYFIRIDGGYRIVKSIRDLCVFAPHNVFKDPPFSRIDLISCCNLLIYLDAILQKKVIATFHYALNNGGYLVLGKSETIGASGQIFSQLEKKFKIYARKNDGSSKARFEMNYRIPELDQTGDARKFTFPNKKEGHYENLEKTVDNILLSKHVPASVVINHDLEILQFRGSTGFFLEPSPGKASLNLIKMARPGLPFELRAAIHKASKSGIGEKKKGIDIKYNGSSFSGAIEVVPIPTNGEEKLFLIIFEKLEVPVAQAPKSGVSKDKIVKKLHQELETIKEDMRSMLEEQEASVEELQSANEEVVSSNEELQSINEELETSKEEVESTNEELMTINNELIVRNDQLAESHEYSQAVFDTIREAVLVLDNDLRVRSANKSFYTIFNIKEEEAEGMLIFELGNKQWDIQTLRELLYEVLPVQPTITAYEIQHEFQNLGEKIMLVNVRKITQKANRNQLILIAIEDITEHRRAEKILAERETWFRNMADNAPVMIWVAGLDKRRNFFNKTWLEFTGQESNINKPTADKIDSWKEAIHPDDAKAYLDLYTISFMERKTFLTEYRLKRHDGEYRWMMDIAKPIYSPEGAFMGYIGSCTELHDKKLLQDELEKRVIQRTRDLEETNIELHRSNSELQQFAYVASHDLQEPLRKIMTFGDRLHSFKNELSDQGKTYLEKIIEASRRMTRLIDDLLDFSRISRTESKFIKTDLNEIIKDVMLDFDVLIAQKKIKMNIGKLPVLRAVPLHMEQLFHNLISNAIKFARTDIIPEISISYRSLNLDEIKERKNLDRNNSYVEIVVKDNGIGFPGEFADQIFIIFQRLNDKKLYPGTGIGLALCYRIAANHGGDIYAISKENEGAAFHVILPLNRHGVEETSTHN